VGLEHAINIDDLRKLAKRRLPKIAYDFIEGGLEDERGIARNESAFAGFDLVPRYGVDVSACDQSTTLFGRTYAGPLGIAPTGIAGLFRPGADLMLAEAAKSANVPFIMSGTGTASMEDLGRIAPEHGWYQIYPARDRAISEDMIRRARDVGLSTLVVTVDVPVNSKRERNLRNGFARPLKMTMKTKLEALLHPGWMAEYLRTGMPLFSNWRQYAPPGATTAEVADFVASQTPVPVLWRDIENFRRLWPGKLVIKGIMHADDATRCAALGCDGIMVSNHGGRQLASAIAPLRVLPQIIEAARGMTVMLDGGVRRGTDVFKALALGATAVGIGRPYVWGLSSFGQAGVERVLQILDTELRLAMVGCGTVAVKGITARSLIDARLRL
jgi:(S)-mandelate dehydrogenase